MTSHLTKTGVSLLGDVPWGTHFCHFYDTAEDLVETSLPFLQAGLESGEFCMWVVPEVLPQQDAWAALRRKIASADEHRQDGRLEVLPNRDWYTRAGAMDLQKVRRGWDDKLNDALGRGHPAIRVVAGGWWSSEQDWRDFCEYEQIITEWLVDRPMTVMCVYSLEISRAADVLDVTRTHQFATARRRGEWEMVEGSALRTAKREIKILSDALEERVIERTRELEAVNEELSVEIVARRRAEEALLKNERQFHAMFDEAKVGIALFDPAGGPYEVNRSLQRMLGYSGEDLAEMSSMQVLERLTHPGDVARARQRFLDLIAGKREDYTAQERYLRKDGTQFWGNLTVSLVRDEKSQTMFGIAMLEDVTDRKRSEDALRKAQGELAHVNRVMTMGEMVASIAHEVSQPLAAVSASAGACERWLARDEPNLVEARAAVEQIVAASSRASMVLQRIRDLVRKTEPLKSFFDVNEVIREVVALTDRELVKHEIVVLTELSSELPPALGDRVQVQQVVLNLVMNGIESMISGAEPPLVQRTILIRSHVLEDEELLVEVQDTGVGLDPKNVSRLFDAFFSTKPSGMGMGLSISRSIIEAHGGRLWAATNTGSGATFQFTLPSHPSPPSEG